MSREKQIEEMARLISTVKRCDSFTVSECIKKKCDYPHYSGVTCVAEHTAIRLYNAGYRKQSENVVELPCKVGDTVYCIWQYSDFCNTDLPVIEESKVTAFVIDEGEVKIIPENYAEKTDSWYRLRAVAFNNDDAEKVLAKMKGGAG